MAKDDDYDFSGVWLSTYTFESSESGDLLETEHYVTMNRIGNQLVVESIPNTTGSYLLGRFSLDGRIATGSYQSQNSPNSASKNALYYGAAQLILDADGKALRGMGVGYSHRMVVKPSKWQLVHVGQHKPTQEEIDETASSHRAVKAE
jgi:hypothetical protein